MASQDFAQDSGLAQHEFSDVIERMYESISYQSVKFETQTASEEETKLYRAIQNNDAQEAYNQMVTSLYRMRFEKLLGQFMVELGKENIDKLKHFAIRPSRNIIDVLAITKDDDREMERGLILAEANANRKLHNIDMRIDVMFYEESDEVPVPSDFVQLKVKEIG